MGQTYARSFDGSGALPPGAAPDVSEDGDRADEREHDVAQSATPSVTAVSSAMRRTMHCTVLVAIVAAITAGLGAHDPSSVPITWNREISRVVYDRCATCHRPGGTAFSLMTYRDAQPHADAIKSSVISRRMPPWGAVKGFGDFRNDIGLTQEQIALFVDWVEGGAPRGNNPNALPAVPKFETSPEFQTPRDGVTIAGEVTLDRAIMLDGVLPLHVPDGAQMQVVAALPDGAVRPLIWLYEYSDKYQHPFLYREPLDLPARTVIRGVRSDAKLLLLPAARSWFWSLPTVRTWFGGSVK
jgi:mono/diheme cytochrome c family protein